jgi:phage gpG-like protein
MAKGVKIRDNKKKWDKLKRAVSKGSKSTGSEVQIGVFSEQGGDLVIYAATNEFGTDRAGPNRNIIIPERSWLRSTYDEQVKKLFQFIKKNKVKIVLGKVSRKSILNKIGFQLVGAMQKKIAEGVFTPNAPSVKSKKTSQGKEGKPLINEGRLRQSITHRIV